VASIFKIKKCIFTTIMSLFITSLNSGSNGNCYYIGTDTTAILIDAGLSCRETERRMNLLHLSMDKVKAIFISHEHTDHIKGLTALVSKYNLPFYITAGTYKRSGLVIKNQYQEFTAEVPIVINEISITPFAKKHDAADPHSFIVQHRGITVGVFTDIGVVCKKLGHYFSQCHAAFLEANYDADMLQNGSYPLHLKNRIRGGSGHLSNKEALQLFVDHKPVFMSHLLLAHLSKENNDPQLVKNLFTNHAGSVAVTIASRYAPTDVIQVDSNYNTAINKPIITPIKQRLQLSLFD
jgi:phosphoribosyl 1,2-cyclic phosphodiesterase